MKRLIFRLIFALLTFTIGLAATSLLLSYRRPASQIIITETKQSEPHAISQPIRFEPGVRACGYIKGGGSFSDSSHTSSDGIGVGYLSAEYPSPSRANKELRRKIKEAIQIIERAPMLNDKREHVGERVVAMFPPNSPFKESASVFWTDGANFYSIDSPSLKNALEFEKPSAR